MTSKFERAETESRRTSSASVCSTFMRLSKSTATIAISCHDLDKAGDYFSQMREIVLRVNDGLSHCLSPQLALQIVEAFDDLILRAVLSIFDDAAAADDRIAHGGACEREDDGG